MWSAFPGEITSVSLDEEEDAGILESLFLKSAKDRGVILVFEGWRPFTAAAGLYTEYVQSLLTEDTPFLVALSGRPGRGFDLEHRDMETFNQWKRLLPAALGSSGCEFVEIKGWG